MSDHISYPAEGISHLVIGTVARDGAVRGVPGVTAIQITYVPGDGQAEPQFIPEGRTTRFTGIVVQLQAPDTLALTIKEALGDLRVQGLTGDVSLEAVHGDLRLESLAGKTFLARADADVRAEGVGELHVLGACNGDLRFNGGRLAADSVDGDVRLNGAGDTRLGRVQGDLWAEKVNGTLQIGSVLGDARLSGVAGMATVAALFGDLRADELTGGLSAVQVRGDVVLHGPFTAAEGYTASADGDIHVHLPADVDARLSVHAMGRIRSDVPLTPAVDGTPTFSATMGQGAGHITLSGRGDLRLTQAGREDASRQPGARDRAQTDSTSELSSLGERIRQQVTSSLAAAGINIDTGEINWGRGGPRSGRGARTTRPPMPSAPPPSPERPKSATPPSGPSADEQLAILKMVEEGKITPQEAETLLQALGT